MYSFVYFIGLMFVFISFHRSNFWLYLFIPFKFNFNQHAISPNRLASCWQLTPAYSHTCSHRSTLNRTTESHHQKQPSMSMIINTLNKMATVRWTEAWKMVRKRHWTTITIPIRSTIIQMISHSMDSKRKIKMNRRKFLEIRGTGKSISL